MKLKSESEVTQLCPTLLYYMDCSLPGSSIHGISQTRVLEWVAIAFSAPALQADSLPAEPQGKPKNTRVGSLSLLQRIFPTQDSYQDLLHCRWVLYQLSHKGTPRTLEWVAYPFSSGSSQPRNQTGVFCITGRFFTN